MRNFFSSLNRVLAEVCGWLLSIIAVLLALDVITRALFTPLQEVASLAVFVMIAVIYLGLANCEQENGHVGVDLLENMFPPGLKRVNTLLRYLVEIVIIGIAVYFVIDNSIESYVRGEALSGTKMLPIWPAKFAMSAGLFFFWIQIVLNFFKALGSRNRGGGEMNGNTAKEH